MASDRSERPIDVEWLKSEKKKSVSLTEELKLFSRYMKLDKTELATRQLVVKEIERCVQAVYPDAAINQFGSYPLGLSIFCSDLDLSVDNVVVTDSVINRLDETVSHNNQNGNATTDQTMQLSDPSASIAVAFDASTDGPTVGESGIKEAEETNTHKQTRRNEKKKMKNVANGLQQLVAPLRKDSFVLSLTFLKHARVPIVKVCYKCGLQADISWNSSGNAGALATKIMVERRGSILVDLSMFLKAYLHQKKLDDPSVGGLGSYSLYVMLCAHIARNPQFLKDPNNPDLGALLLSFLKFYSDPKLFRNHTVIEIPEADPLRFTHLRLIHRLQSAFNHAYVALARKNGPVAPVSRKSLVGATATAAPSPVPPVTAIDAHLHKVLNVDALVLRRKKANVDCTHFLNEAARLGISATNPFSKYLRKMHSDDGQGTALGNPVLAPSTIGAVRNYSVSCRTYSPCSPSSNGRILAETPPMLHYSPKMPIVATRMRFGNPLGHSNGGFLYTSGVVFNKLCRLKLLR